MLLALGSIVFAIFVAWFAWGDIYKNRAAILAFDGGVNWSVFWTDVSFLAGSFATVVTALRLLWE